MAYSGSSAPQRISVALPDADVSVTSGPAMSIDGRASTAVDYSAHPFLDPSLFRRDREALRYFRRAFRDSMERDEHYARLLNQLLHPIGEPSPIEEDERTLGRLQDQRCRRYVSVVLSRSEVDSVLEHLQPPFRQLFAGRSTMELPLPTQPRGDQPDSGKYGL